MITYFFVSGFHCKKTVLTCIIKQLIVYQIGLSWYRHFTSPLVYNDVM